MTNEKSEVPEIKFYASSSILRVNPFADIEELYSSYLEALKSLHKDLKVNREYFNKFHTLVVGAVTEDRIGFRHDTNSALIPNSTVIVFGVVFVDGKPKVVTTVQANLLMHIPQNSVFINNVATHKEFKGQGFGKKTMNFLEQWISEYWMFDVQIIKLVLTNSPKKENGGFYISCGFEARGPESEKPTVVWQKCVEKDVEDD